MIYLRTLVLCTRALKQWKAICPIATATLRPRPPLLLPMRKYHPLDEVNMLDLEEVCLARLVMDFTDLLHLAAHLVNLNVITDVTDDMEDLDMVTCLPHHLLSVVLGTPTVDGPTASHNTITEDGLRAFSHRAKVPC